jgi:hypothetical protein
VLLLLLLVITLMYGIYNYVPGNLHVPQVRSVKAILYQQLMQHEINNNNNNIIIIIIIIIVVPTVTTTIIINFSFLNSKFKELN